jgi:hypothetical protein
MALFLVSPRSRSLCPVFKGAYLRGINALSLYSTCRLPLTPYPSHFSLLLPADLGNKPFQTDVSYIDIGEAGKGLDVFGFFQIKTAA